MEDGRHFENRYISPYLDEILYTAADFELDERHVIKNEKVALDRLRVRRNVFLGLIKKLHRMWHFSFAQVTCKLNYSFRVLTYLPKTAFAVCTVTKLTHNVKQKVICMCTFN